MTKILKKTALRRLPVLVLKNLILLPKEIISVKISKKNLIHTINESIKKYNGELFVTFNEENNPKDLDLKKLQKNGVFAQIFETFDEKEGDVKILIEGISRAKVKSFKLISFDGTDILMSSCSPVVSEEELDPVKKEAFFRNLTTTFKEYQIIKEPKFPASVTKIIKEAASLDFLIDLIASSLDLKYIFKSELFNEIDIFKRAELLLLFLKNELAIYETEKKIRKRVVDQVEKQQKDYYLTEQLRAIYKELGKDDISLEVNSFKEEAIKINMAPEAFEKLINESKKLEQMPLSSPEAVISRNYIDLLLSLPWAKKSIDDVSIEQAKLTLESSHDGMNKVKEAVLDFLAAKKFAKESLINSPIICLVGPPGVGKTTLAESISKAMKREFIRISLGGLRDEAEIRGHRKTYIGAMPGKIITSMRKAKTINPVILLDEIDKMSGDFRGDPASALLEVLDTVQNKSFIDNFLEVGYDLSNVLFIATANSCDNIPLPLLDRMELIGLYSYTEEEKLKIFTKFLLPKALLEHAIPKEQFICSDNIIKKIITEYTKEAGVRQLNRILIKIIRKSIFHVFSQRSNETFILSEKNIIDWLGYSKFKNNFNTKENLIGIVTGLAWTEVGGDILEIEVVKIKGKGNLLITGQLGEVMQESAQASLSYIKYICKTLGIKESVFANIDLHIHVPEGATPKDGPSAGIAIATALVSVITGCPVYKNIAMTGEITLQGRVLAVGGLKEKILAASRLNIKTVLVPRENKAEVEEICKEITVDLSIIFVSKLDEVLNLALVKKLIIPSLKFKDENKKPIYKKNNIIIPTLKSKTKNKLFRIRKEEG